MKKVTPTHRARFYDLLLRLYPHSYRTLFGTQMRQTFIDHYQDVEASEGVVSMQFWLALITDEIPNIAREHAASMLERHPFLKFTTSKLVLAALIFSPL